MRKLNIFILLISFLLNLSCKTDEMEYFKDSNGIVRIKKPLWKVSLADGDYVSGSFDPILYNNYVIMGCTKNKKPGWTAIHTKTGEKIWEKNPPFRFGSFHPRFYYVYENKFVASDGRVQVFDLNTGEKVWENTNGNSNIGRVYGIDNLLFTNEIENNVNNPFLIETGWFYDLQNYTGTKYFTPDLGYIPPNYEVSYSAGGVEFQVPFKNEENEILVFIFTSSFVQNKSGQDFVHLYNFTKKEWVYTNLEMTNSPYNSGLYGLSFALYDNKIYFTAVNGIECYDLKTGKQIWRYFVNQGTGGIIIAENKVIGIEGDINKRIVALNPDNGNLLWSLPTTAGILTSNMKYMNGIVYFTSGTDGCLHAVDITTHKYVWLIDSPDLQKDNDAWFISNISVQEGTNGEKGKVFVSSYLNGYCYEAEK